MVDCLLIMVWMWLGIEVVGNCIMGVCFSGNLGGIVIDNGVYMNLKCKVRVWLSVILVVYLVF